MSERGSGKRTIEWTWVVRGHGLPERMSVLVCVCLYLCTRAEGELESILEAPHMTVIEKALLIACWCEGRDFKKKKWKKINSIETLHPSVHKAPPAPQRPRKRLCNRHLYVSKSLCTPPTTSTAAWALQWQHVSTRGSSFPRGQSGAAHHWSGSVVLAESTIAPQ